MRKLFLVLIAGVAALSASAQVNYKIQTACNPQDVKTYDTERLRSSFLMEKVMVPDQINVTYSMYDRFIFGGAVPVTKELVLETIDPLKAPSEPAEPIAAQNRAAFEFVRDRIVAELDGEVSDSLRITQLDSIRIGQ